MKVRLSSLVVGQVFRANGHEYAVLEHLPEKKTTKAVRCDVDYYKVDSFFTFHMVFVDDEKLQLTLF